MGKLILGKCIYRVWCHLMLKSVTYLGTHRPTILPFKCLDCKMWWRGGRNDAKPFWSACQWQCPPTHPPSLLLSWRPFSPLDATIYWDATRLLRWWGVALVMLYRFRVTVLTLERFWICSEAKLCKKNSWNLRLDNIWHFLPNWPQNKVANWSPIGLEIGQYLAFTAQLATEKSGKLEPNLWGAKFALNIGV